MVDLEGGAGGGGMCGWGRSVVGLESHSLEFYFNRVYFVCAAVSSLSSLDKKFTVYFWLWAQLLNKAQGEI